MKEFKFLIPVTALFAVGVFTTSCSDDNSSVELKTVEVNRTHDLTLTSNVDAKFVVEGQEVQTGTTATFSNLTDKSVKVTVTANDADFVIPANSQTMTVNFADENVSDAVNFTFAKLSSNQAAQANAKGKIVTNDAENASAFCPVSIMIPENVEISGNTTDPFSVVAYVPTENVKEVTNGNTTTAKVTLLSLQCAPNNGYFTPALPMKARLDKIFAGMRVTVGDKEYVVDGEGYVNFEVPHFSVWNLEGSVEYTKVLTDGWETISSEIVNFDKGVNRYSYTVNTGWELVNGEASEAVKAVVDRIKYFGGPFGSKKMSTPYASSIAGPRTIVVNQLYNDYAAKCDGYEFTIRVWGVPRVGISDVHSGGSGK
jgi:hypothetical protein